MSKYRLQPPAEDQNAFTDILFNALLGFVFMFSVAFMLIRPEVTDGKIVPKAEFMITAQWPDGHVDDIDLIVEDGEGNIVWFDTREAGLMHLDRDDRVIDQQAEGDDPCTSGLRCIFTFLQCIFDQST